MLSTGAIASMAVVATVLVLAASLGRYKSTPPLPLMLPVLTLVAVASALIWLAGPRPEVMQREAPRPPPAPEARDGPHVPAEHAGPPRKQDPRPGSSPGPADGTGRATPGPPGGIVAAPAGDARHGGADAVASPGLDAAAPPADAAADRSIAPRPATAGADAKHSVVPVFYGTDRERREGLSRIAYGPDRGRRLEMGRALVSVPVRHEAPGIERPWALRIPYFDVKVYEEKEDPEKHFTIRELRALTREELLALVAERLGASKAFPSHALVFVHGFNTSFDNAVYRTAQIVHDLGFDGAPFLYSWPSGGAVASYTFDRESAGQAEPYMRAFVDLVVKESGAKAISVIAHSMGNQLLLPVLAHLKSAAPEAVIHQIILAAPDVDRDNFENLAREIRGVAKGMTLYAAANDRALGVSRRFHGGIPRAGDVPASGPLVIEGIDTIDVTAVSTDSLGINHSGYAESNALLNDIKLILQTGERPPEKRIPILARIAGPRGDFWRYPSGP